MTIQKKYRGDTVGRTFYIKNESGVLIDPTTLAIVIVDSLGVTIATKAITDCTHPATGTYKFWYNIPATAAYGVWQFRVTPTLTAGALQNTEVFTFEVEEL